ncbi:MAG TPA: serine/threonine-protein kinase [Polyangiaceae bacterium]|nr:serine/threonine-protein kinase [Polyangiaceae bacterium]
MVSTPELDSIVGGKYRLVRALGAGGMGTVYEAENVLTLKRAAIKWLHPQFAGNEQAYQRVIHEARASSRIRHENVVDVYDVVHEGDSIFLVMELLIGEPLADLLAREPPALHELIALLLPAMRGLAAAHAAGVVHRDIKPENIFLAQKPGYSAPVPKIIDFGISKVFDPESANLTRSGVTMGTPKYVSYEQLVGARDVDPRTDVYAFGVILYEALTGRAPYDGAKTFGEQAIYFATTVPASPRALRPEVPEALDALVMRAIAKERDARWPSLDAFIESLEPFAQRTAYAACLSSFPPWRSITLAEAPTAPTPTPTPVPTARRSPAPSPRDAENEPGFAEASRSSRPRRKGRSLVLGAIVASAMGAIVAWMALREQDPRPVKSAAARASAASDPAKQSAPPPAKAAAPTSAPPWATDARPQEQGFAPAVPPARPARPRLVRRVDAAATVDSPLPQDSHDSPAQTELPASPDAGNPARDYGQHRAGPVKRQEF